MGAVRFGDLRDEEELLAGSIVTAFGPVDRAFPLELLFADLRGEQNSRPICRGLILQRFSVVGADQRFRDIEVGEPLIGKREAHLGEIGGDGGGEHGADVDDLPDVYALFGDAPVIIGRVHGGAGGVAAGLRSFGLGNADLRLEIGLQLQGLAEVGLGGDEFGLGDLDFGLQIGGALFGELEVLFSLVELFLSHDDFGLELGFQLGGFFGQIPAGLGKGGSLGFGCGARFGDLRFLGQRRGAGELVPR